MCCGDISREEQEKEEKAKEYIRGHLIGAIEILIEIANKNNIHLEVKTDIDLYKMTKEFMGDQALFTCATVFRDTTKLWEAVPDIVHVENNKIYGTGDIKKETLRKAFENLVELFFPVACDF
ncbi:MAG: hypothetical protein WA093_02640 [Minisyncoccales bacterium]|jgi:hypothetical protein